MREKITFWVLLAIVGIVLFYPKFRSIDKAHIGGPWPEVSGGGITTALGAYEVDNGSYPKSLQDMVRKPNGATNWHGPYFEQSKLPIDPWGNHFFYEYPGKHFTNGYDLFSAGPDGKPGTGDDIVNW